MGHKNSSVINHPMFTGELVIKYQPMPLLFSFSLGYVLFCLFRYCCDKASVMVAKGCMEWRKMKALLQDTRKTTPKIPQRIDEPQ